MTGASYFPKVYKVLCEIIWVSARGAIFPDPNFFHPSSPPKFFQRAQFRPHLTGVQLHMMCAFPHQTEPSPKAMLYHSPLYLWGLAQPLNDLMNISSVLRKGVEILGVRSVG